MNSAAPNPSAPELIRELFHEAAAYLQAWVSLLKAEWTEKARTARLAAGLAAAALIFLGIGFWLLTMALTFLIAWGLGNWGWAFLIVGGAYIIVAGLLLVPAIHALQSGVFRFDHSLDRVRDDLRLVKSKLAA